MTLHTYKMECLTNLHVGDGDTNYNIIDNQVQRDVVLGVPTIHSSGVKGALRYYFEKIVKADKQLIGTVFGGEDENCSMGEYKFFAANLIAMPLRISKGNGSYVLATCKAMIDNEAEFLVSLGRSEIGLKEKVPCCPSDMVMMSIGNSLECEVEGMPVKRTESKLLDWMIGENWALLSDQEFKKFDLPVQARNVLDNGKSKNLWYEEVVPHKSIFMLSILTPDKANVLDKDMDGKVIQFGANDSIGYGYCRIEKF